MSRVATIKQEEATGLVKSLYTTLISRIGHVPNIFLTMANSPEALAAFVQMQKCAAMSSLPEDIKSYISLAMAEANECQYCLSAHSAIAKSIGLQESDILKARSGAADNKKNDQILKFVKSVVQKRGAVSDKEVQDLKAQGVTDREICDIILLISLNNFSNYFNKINNTDIDFPPIQKLERS